MPLIAVLTLVTLSFAGWRAWRRLRYFLHIFQLEGYKRREFLLWLRGRRVLFRLSHRLAVAELAAVAAGSFLLSPFWTAVVALPAWAATFASSRPYRSDRAKKPLKFTHRMTRLASAAAILAVVPVVTGLLVWIQGGLAFLFAFLAGLFLADVLAPFWVAAASVLLGPVEKAIQQGFKRKAKAHLRRRPDLIVIGITGSYGKTSTKFILKEVLSGRFNVLATPGSYNTPMGLCLVINEMLRPEHQVLILEMGIRHPRDMRELCEIARPDVAVVTSVGLAHLESMGTIEAIAREKGELVASMKPSGTAVLNVDDERVAAMAARAPGDVWRVSAAGMAGRLETRTVAEEPRSREGTSSPTRTVTASDLEYGAEGSRFLVRDDTGTERTFRTRLLGEHNVINILLGVAVGRALGLRLRQMAYAVEQIQPVEHRLQLRREGPITVIDDAFNSNPVGARSAVEILGRFNSGRRIIVTPGMIELGERQHEENRIFGEHIAANVDMAVLVGREQTRPIQEGLRARNFPEEKLRVVPTLAEAQHFLKSYLRPGDVVLYENDLPDQYAETP